MNDVVDYERDFRRVKQGETLIYTTLHGLKPDLSMPSDMPSVLDEKAKIEVELSEKPNKEQNESSSENSSDDDEDDDDYDSEEGESGREEEQLEDGTIRKKTKNMEIHNRPRDESPNSKRVYIF